MALAIGEVAVKLTQHQAEMVVALADEQAQEAQRRGYSIDANQWRAIAARADEAGEDDA